MKNSKKKKMVAKTRSKKLQAKITESSQTTKGCPIDSDKINHVVYSSFKTDTCASDSTLGQGVPARINFKIGDIVGRSGYRFEKFKIINISEDYFGLAEYEILSLNLECGCPYIDKVSELDVFPIEDLSLKSPKDQALIGIINDIRKQVKVIEKEIKCQKFYIKLFFSMILALSVLVLFESLS